MSAAVFPGAANDLQLEIAGPITVLRPNVEVEVVRVYWGGLGADYLTRRPTVAYRITNAGSGSPHRGHPSRP
jgi:hypothetical protein